MDITVFLFIFAVGFSTRMNLPAEAQNTERFRRSDCEDAVIEGTLGAISLVLLIFNIAAICYILRNKRFEALPKSPDHSDQTHGNQDSSEGGENVYAQLGEQEPQQQYTELELQRRGTQFHEENERQNVNQRLPQFSDNSDQTHSNQDDREGCENTYAQLGEQEPQHQYTELELQRRGTQFYEVNERQYVNLGFQMGVADSHDI
ncbi:uncharacterized protein LOC106160361 isoform X2 [Lingula anatina]|uniref:Uncharacterized protein LOC106160361 isoform X2 n=1 Tax=Lingula anatina TaxID=7574 RepID=A0A1S3I2C5_LINAN|nr:uncharacterized protein LOC106160361 isoform X2 [Lingula anatina]|eukprot:XP_013392398.1 uncharacterized protein LOC106160361 isoform X2 [Lingula anatina]